VSDDEILAAGETFLLVKSDYGYQIWERSEFGGHGRGDLPHDEFGLSAGGQRAAWLAYARYEPDAVTETTTEAVDVHSQESETEHAARSAALRELSLAEELRQAPPLLLAITPRFEVAEYRIIAEHGLVTGSTVRARGLGAKIVAGVTQNLGGELPGYTKLLQEARREAVERMSVEAVRIGANAVVAVQFAASELFEIAVELLAYGAAVTVEPFDEPQSRSERYDRSPGEYS